jgi:hypothetical protein
MSNNVVLWSVADDLRGIATELESLTLYTDDVTDVPSMYPKRGTIVKAKPSQTRFKQGSMWVSNGDGTYTHITGKKFLQAKHDRLDGFVDTYFTA